jgi:hypothetical protein
MKKSRAAWQGDISFTAFQADVFAGFQKYLYQRQVAV